MSVAPEDAIKQMKERLLRIIALVTFVPFALFAWLKIDAQLIRTFVVQSDPNLIITITLAAYLLLWKFGLTNDLIAQARLYTKAPNDGQLSRTAWGAVAVLFAVFLTICAFNHFGWLTPAGTAILFTILFLADFIGWFSLKSMVRPVVEESRRTYTVLGDHVKLFQLEATRQLVTGHWKILRGLCGGAILAVLLVCTQSPDVFARLASLIGVDALQTLVAWGIVLYVVLMEGCIWYLRLRHRCLCEAAEVLGKSYDLTPKSQPVTPSAGGAMAGSPYEPGHAPVT